MKNLNKEIEQIRDIILNTREFCGDEKAAATEEAFELGLRGKDAETAIRAANFQANGQWNLFKREAGVNEKHLF